MELHCFREEGPAQVKMAQWIVVSQTQETITQNKDFYGGVRTIS